MYFRRFWCVFCFFSFLFLSIASGVGAEAFLKDIPDAHWASQSVYEAVQSGLLQGYPDGTFRGNHFVSRYEAVKIVASLLQVLNEQSEIQRKQEEALSTEDSARIQVLEEELAELRNEIAEYQKPPKESVSGYFLAQFRETNPIDANASRRNTRADYRLKLTTQFQEMAFNIDTTDNGFNSATTVADPARDYFDISWGTATKLGALLITSGPGDKTHGTDTLVPAESGRIYRRPWQSASLYSLVHLSGKEVMLWNRYLARGTVNDTGVPVNQYSFQVDFPLTNRFLGIGRLGGNVDAYFTGLSSQGTKDFRGTLYGNGSWGDWYGFAQLGSSGGSSSSALMGFVNLVHNLNWEKETRLSLLFAKVGSQYLNAGLNEVIEVDGQQLLNYFDKPFLAGMVDLGFQVDHRLEDEQYQIFAKGDFVLSGNFQYGRNTPGSEWTIEVGARRLLGEKNHLLELAFQSYQQPANTTAPTSEVLRLSYRHNI